MTRQHGLDFTAYYRWLTLKCYLDTEFQTDSVLDVGCGDGYFLSKRAERFRVGVDLQPRLLTDDGLSVVQADGCMLPFADESFPLILALDIIEHIPDDNALIASLTRVLAPGGRIWLSTPSDTWNLILPWLTRRAMRSWGHQRAGYDVDDMVTRFPSGYSMQATLWSELSLRFFYVPLRLLSMLSPALARLGARLCFEVDRRLSGGCDHIFLEVIRDRKPSRSNARDAT
jgi:SAM-dependent methyltransferase